MRSGVAVGVGGGDLDHDLRLCAGLHEPGLPDGITLEMCLSRATDCEGLGPLRVSRSVWGMH